VASVDGDSMKRSASWACAGGEAATAGEPLDWGRGIAAATARGADHQGPAEHHAGDDAFRTFAAIHIAVQLHAERCVHVGNTYLCTCLVTLQASCHWCSFFASHRKHCSFSRPCIRMVQGSRCSSGLGLPPAGGPGAASSAPGATARAAEPSAAGAPPSAAAADRSGEPRGSPGAKVSAPRPSSWQRRRAAAARAAEALRHPREAVSSA
jgi:hypothetical protein